MVRLQSNHRLVMKIYIIREYIKGVSLEVIVRNEGAQSVDNVRDWAKQLCEVLGYLHSLNPPVIYRDMKPANVILASNGELKIIDFGIAKVQGYINDTDTCCLGTWAYAAPEQFSLIDQSYARTDIFCLGRTLHRLVTGVDPLQPPYEIRPIREYDPKLPKGLEYIIEKSIRMNPVDRYQSCKEMLEDLNNYENLPKRKGIIRRFFKS